LRVGKPSFQKQDKTATALGEEFVPPVKESGTLTQNKPPSSARLGPHAAKRTHIENENTTVRRALPFLAKSGETIGMPPISNTCKSGQFSERSSFFILIKCSVIPADFGKIAARPSEKSCFGPFSFEIMFSGTGQQNVLQIELPRNAYTLGRILRRKI